MSDLIDRQRALDAFDYWVKSPMVGYSNGLLRLHEMLEEIPPATQEPCEDAISRQAVLNLAKFDGRDGLGSIIHAFDVEQLPPVTAEKVGQWIPVSERLPEEETDILVCNANGDIEISRGSYSTEMENEFMWYTSGWRFGKVIAWMPLPLPYKASPTDEEVEE